MLRYAKTSPATSAPAMSRYSTTERIGVNAVEGIVLHELQWIFREQPIEDKGIDGHIERAEAGDPSGKLVALQIKTGRSHFRKTAKGYTYYGDNTHLAYWLGHALPVILVAHLPDANETLWVQVTEKAVTRTDKGWRIVIPFTQTFGRATRGLLEAVFDGTPAQQHLRRLSLDLPLMRHI